MQNAIFKLNITGCWMLSLILSFATEVAADNYSNETWPQYTPASQSKSTNPWALPESYYKKPSDANGAGSNQPAVQCPATGSSQSIQTPSPAKNWNFVTPKVLDSLKQQQTQLQTSQPAYSNRRPYSGYRQPGYMQAGPLGSVINPGMIPGITPGITPGIMPGYALPQMYPVQQYSRQAMPGYEYPASANQGYYRDEAYPQTSDSPNNSFYDMNPANPVFEAPAGSPWSNGNDVLYHGDAIPGTTPPAFDGAYPDVFGPGISNPGTTSPTMSNEVSPWQSSEALGGLSPMFVPPEILNNTESTIEKSGGMSDSGVDESSDDNVFNPFTFIPNKYLQ